MKYLKLLKKNAQRNTSVLDEEYERLIIKRIRERYTLNQELAILRQRDSKPDEFATYNAYVEECKAIAKQELAEV
jgi:hypothetical protein